MYTLRGKHAFANIMLPDGEALDEATTQQVYSFLNHPAFGGSYIAIMPDAHAGKGACVGFTMKANGYVVPNVVGVDIGCGMAVARLRLRSEDWAAFDAAVRETIPSGFSRHKDYRRNAGGIDGRELADYGDVADRVGQDEDVTLGSIGTLGGGNHFIEVDATPDGSLALVVHTGSRNLGLKVAEHYQARARELMRAMFVGDAYKGLEFLPMEMGGADYLRDMRVAQRYASRNRRTIVSRLLERLARDGLLSPRDSSESFGSMTECVHNYIDDGGVVRKGAISARMHEPVVIPLNMRDGVVFGTGKGSDKWNQSAPHGAGRILSRTAAKDRLTLDEYREAMQGVWTSCVSKDTLDEAPQAYKPADMILGAIGESVRVLFVARPVYNFKAGGE